MKKTIRLLVGLVTALSLVFSLTIVSNAAPNIQSNVSKTAVSANLSSRSLPSEVSEIQTGVKYYFNIAATNSNYIKSFTLYCKYPGESNFHKADSVTAKNYMRYTSIPITFGEEKVGTLYYYWTATYKDRKGTDTFRTRSIKIVSSKSNSSSNSNTSNVKRVIPFTGTKTVAIRTAVDWNKVICVKGNSDANAANVHIWKYYPEEESHHWDITYVGNGYYKIINSKTNKALDVVSSVAANKTNVCQFEYYGNDNQLWEMYEAPKSGYVYFKSKIGNYYLDIEGGYANDGTNVEIYQFGYNNYAQMYYLEEVESSGNGTAEPMKSYYHTWGKGNSWLANCRTYGRSNAGGRNIHLGVDLMSKSDSNIYAMSAGKVVDAGYNKANGNYVTIQSDFSGKTAYVFYAHMNSRSVSNGQIVSAGTKIGVVGHTGSVAKNSVNHLHLAVVDKLSKGGGYYGYGTSGSGNKASYSGKVFYNPIYVLNYNKLP